MEVGLRVVRGPDWQWANQDGGEGYTGTVVEIGKPGSSTSPDKTVVVQWDIGARTNYRIGYQGCFDLKIWDNAPIGVKHPNIVCDSCKKQGIAGMRWKCLRCRDFDLCTLCYMADKHDLTHPFLRFETASSAGVEVSERQSSTKIPLWGMFVGCKVVRGPDWDWGQQDGGEGKIGRITDIRGWDNESGRSVAHITWASGATNVYRLGHKGKVDLRAIQPALGGYFYKEHLPVLGAGGDPQLRCLRPLGPGSPKTAPSTPTFNVGDKVQVVVDVETLKEMQEGHGGWNPRMAEYIGQQGTVHRVTERGDIRVQYEGCNNRWTFHPRALAKLCALAVGDVVRVSDDMAKVREWQHGHGEWIDVMKNALGKTGKVTKVYADGDARVNVEGHTWTFNPLCLSLVPGSATELSNTMSAQAHQRAEHANPLASLLSHFLVGTSTHPSCGVSTEQICERLVRASAQGHIDVVRDLLQQFPDHVDGRSSGKTCLQVACHQGHVELVRLLLQLRANPEVTDDDGDSALHYAAFGNQSEVMELLLSSGAHLNSSNRGKCTPLHVAVNKQYLNCVQVLLAHNCNVNVQDSFGDTALHDAIGKENTDIVDLLVAAPTVDFTLKNKRGFNVLHHAALKGNAFAVERLLGRSRQLVDVKKDDGFASLHLASLNGHKAVAAVLLQQGQATVDIANNRKQTPLHLAVSQGHCGLAELLVEAGASLREEDEDGDTALLVACLKHASLKAELCPGEAPTIYRIHEEVLGRGVERDFALGISLAAFLIQKGSDVTKKNRKGKTAMDLIPEPYLQEVLLFYRPTTPRVASPVELTSVVETVPRLPAEREGVAPLILSSTVTEETSENLEGGATGGQDKDSTEVGAVGVTASPPLSPSLAPDSKTYSECLVCSDAPPAVVFEPCNHRIACVDCAARMKKCLQCGQLVTNKVTTDGQELMGKQRQPSSEHVKYLEHRLAEMEEAHCCSICMERRRNVAFLCGHSACEVCAQTLKMCHMCRKLIARKINLY